MHATKLLVLRVAAANIFRYSLKGQHDFSEGAKDTVVLSLEHFIDLVTNYNVREADYEVADVIFNEDAKSSD